MLFFRLLRILGAAWVNAYLQEFWRSRSCGRMLYFRLSS